MMIECPHCGTTLAWGPESPYRPFCSARCRLIDLGEWLDESRRIPLTETAVPQIDPWDPDLPHQQS